MAGGGGGRSCFVKRDWQTGKPWKKGDRTHKTQKKDMDKQPGGGSYTPTGGATDGSGNRSNRGLSGTSANISSFSKSNRPAHAESAL